MDTCPIDCQPPTLAQRQPHFSVQWVDTTLPGAPDRLTRYAIPATPPPWSFTDDHLTARVSVAADGTYLLSITGGARAAEIRKVSFPWIEASDALPDPSADRVYFTYLGGVTERSDRVGPYTAGQGFEYPGTAFSPFVIIADDRHARLTAATTWPPRRVKVGRDPAATSGIYAERFTPGQVRSYGLLLADVEGRPERGYPPWLIAVDRYRRWFSTRYTPPAPPAWMAANHGYLLYALQDANPDDEPTLEAVWSQYGPVLGWIQFWGQMSPGGGSCCGESSTMHARFSSWLPAWARRKTALGARVGYYARPLGTWPGDDAPDPHAQTTITSWLARNRDEYGANTFYIDVLGRAPAPPSEVSSAFAGWPADTMIEGFVDVYPAASLMSGYVSGGDWPGGPTLDTRSCERCTFIRLGRYVQGERFGYYGVSNGEHALAGAATSYWAERQMFLLGLKAETTATMWSPILPRIFGLRDAHRWWARAPRYVDVLGLSSIPEGIEVRRFVDRSGASLLTVDNPGRLAGRTVRVRDRVVALPADDLAIVEVPAAVSP
ncbi:hypothetical protein L6R52_05765 [Myxococcota bacterium]|nr:hypothetical protein [Myxococcota bacterium]